MTHQFNICVSGIDTNMISNLVSSIDLGAALDFGMSVGMEYLHQHALGDAKEFSKIQAWQLAHDQQHAAHEQGVEHRLAHLEELVHQLMGGSSPL